MPSIRVGRSRVRRAHDAVQRRASAPRSRLAHALVLSVVAEGAEREDALDLLCSLGFDAAPENYLAPPVPANVLRVEPDYVAQ
jgi:EAL domain-containing protein (putative c-di-GMP-specific phosphodiesterase class I)